MTTHEVARRLGNVRTGLSAHSLKHGAIDELARMSAAGKIDPSLVARLAKHKQQSDLVESTVRYVTDKVALARMLGTQAATALL
jgi:hypothetical protein